MEDNSKNTPLRIAAQNKQLNLIPYPILKQNLELLKAIDNIETILAEAKSEFSKNIRCKIQTHNQPTMSK